MFFNSELEQAMEHFSKTGGFLSVKSGGKTNTMTVGWGFVGFMWNRPYFITVVRPQRYTTELLKTADSFTISVPFGSMLEELKICGSKSGRDIDKSGIVKFMPSKKVESPIVDGCDVYYECKIKYAEKLDGEALPEDVKNTFYKGDFHDVYFGEIVDCYGCNEG